MHAEKLHSFVLSSLDYGDNDRIASLFSLEHGRIRVFARGARKSRKRFGPALEPFARIEAEVRIKDGLSSIHQADVLSLYPGIRSDLARIALALYACELVDAITAEGQPYPRLFRLLAACFDRLETATATDDDRRFFEINLLNILGYRPSLESCSRCDTPFDERGAYLLDHGEAVCRSCTAGGQPLYSSTLKALASCLKTGTFGQIPFSAETLQQGGSLLDDAIAAHTGRRLKSLDFLRQITT